GVDTVVGDQQRVIMGNIQTVRAIAEASFPKRAQIVAVAIEDHNRVLSTRQDVHIVVCIDGYTGAFVEGDAGREFAPSLDVLITKIADSIDFTHVLPPFTTDKDISRMDTSGSCSGLFVRCFRVCSPQGCRGPSTVPTLYLTTARVHCMVLCLHNLSLDIAIQRL